VGDTTIDKTELKAQQANEKLLTENKQTIQQAIITSVASED